MLQEQCVQPGGVASPLGRRASEGEESTRPALAPAPAGEPHFFTRVLEAMVDSDLDLCLTPQSFHNTQVGGLHPQREERSAPQG